MCTRIYLNDDTNNITLTARNMDWFQRFDTNLWAFSAGVRRNSMPEDAENGFNWESRFNSIAAVITAGSNNNVELISTTDGLNEAGLVINTLYLAESDYNIEAPAITKNMSMGIWGQYLLDNYGCVREAIQGWVKEKARIITMEIPSVKKGEPNKAAMLHISLSDKEGKSAIFEYYKSDGIVKLHITTNIQSEHLNLPDSEHLCLSYLDDCRIMTNSPNYSQQVKLNYYWQWQWEEGATPEEVTANSAMRTHTLPGTHRAPDRFVRTSFYLDHTDRQGGSEEAIGQMFSLIRQAAVPNGYRIDGNNAQPNDSNTIWNVVSDHTNKMYYFQSAIFPNLIWVNLRKVSFANGCVAYKLPLHETGNSPSSYLTDRPAGNVTSLLHQGAKAASDFQFYPARK
jgi:penicillin V acylase-like amidase (Ntn superfamily)